MTRIIGILAALAALAGLVYFGLAGSGPAPPTVAFAPVTRQTLVSTIVTNGRIEPGVFATLRASRDGVLTRFTLERGARVAAGQEVGRIADPAESSVVDRAAAEARIAEARSELAALDQGGSPAARAEIDGSLAAAKLDLATSRRELERTERLVARQAETAEALTAARDRLHTLETQIAALEKRRAALTPSAPARVAAEARLKDGEAALAAVDRRAGQTVLRAPIAGTVFHLLVRPDAFVRAGDAIAEIARTDAPVKAVVFVDEPELGRVARGMKVRLTWDAMPERVWEAAVDRLPTQIVPLNSRQVGEVVCLIGDAATPLPPGANVNAEIRSKEAAGVLAVPKAALRREGPVTGVFVLDKGAKLAWRPVQLGVSSLTHAEVTAGLSEADRVALPADVALSAGQLVIPAR